MFWLANSDNFKNLSSVLRLSVKTSSYSYLSFSEAMTFVTRSYRNLMFSSSLYTGTTIEISFNPEGVLAFWSWRESISVMVKISALVLGRVISKCSILHVSRTDLKPASLETLGLQSDNTSSFVWGGIICDLSFAFLPQDTQILSGVVNWSISTRSRKVVNLSGATKYNLWPCSAWNVESCSIAFSKLATTSSTYDIPIAISCWKGLPRGWSR